MKRLTESSGRIADGALGERVHVHGDESRVIARYRGRDEMDELAETFNRMSSTLERNFSDLESLNTDLYRANQLNENILNSISLALTVVDLEGRVLEWNSAYAEWTGIDKAEALGKHYATDLGGSFSDTNVSQEMADLLSHREPVALQNLSFSATESESRTVNLVGFPLRDVEGEVFGAVIVLEDVTERAQLEAQLQQSARLASVGELAAGVAHEVNNPLGSISSLAQMLLSSPGGEQSDALRTIVDQVNRISGILGNLVDFSRARPAVKEQVEISEVVDSVVGLAKFNRKFRDIEIDRRLDPACPHITGDAGQIQQLLLNLLLNSADAMPTGGLVKIETDGHPPGEQSMALKIRVTDTGHGIPENQINRVFDPFFTTKPTGEGTGLGLSVCYGVVRSHDGEIAVESEEGFGTTFVIDLPTGEAEGLNHQDTKGTKGTKET